VASDRSLAIFLSLLVGGCSLSIQGPAPDRPRHLVPACDTGKGSVALDGIMATGLGIGAFAALDEDAEGTGLALLATAGLFVASAIRGNGAANECRVAYGEYNAAYMRARRQESVGELPRPPAPRPIVKRPPAEVEPEVPPVVASPEPAPAYATPRPSTPPKPAPPPKPDPDDDDWSAFWKEAP
jgi:hypothetical protein